MRAPAPQEKVAWEERVAKAVPRGVSTAHPLLAVRGEGAWVYDAEGRAYLDGMTGIGVLNVGHAHPAVVQAVQEQVARLTHTSLHTLWNAPYVELAEALCARMPGSGPHKALLVNSGAEAVENAVKIARAHTGREAVLTFDQAFHGRTYMAMALTHKAHGYKEGFGPFPGEVVRAPSAYCYRCPVGREPATCRVECLEAVDKVVAVGVGQDELAAVIVEPVQGEGGFIPMPKAFMEGIRALCDRTGAVLIVDEIQCGMGRSGTLWASEQLGITPDLLLTAKSLAGGLPLGAVVGRTTIMDSVSPGGLGGTFGGNPVAAAAALAVLRLMEEESLPRRAAQIGRRLRCTAEAVQANCPLVGDVRGLGAMIGIEMVDGMGAPAPQLATAVVTEARERGLLLMKAGIRDNVVRLLPPLILSDDELEAFAVALEGALRAACRAA